MVEGKVVAHYMYNINYMKKLVVGKVVVHLCLTLIIKELKFSVEHDRLVTTLNTIKH
jgi:hypothetical protein